MTNRIKSRKILIVDDSEMNRSILIDMLSDEYEILEAEDGEEAVALLRQYSKELSAVLLDIIMPKMDGFEVLEIMNKYHWIDDLPVIMISANNTAAYIEKAFGLGIADCIIRPFDLHIVRRRIVNIILAYSKQRELAGRSSQNNITEKANNNTIPVTLSDRTFKLLEHERMKYRFFASMSEEIQYEYIDMPSVINISELGAMKLGLPEKIINPYSDNGFLDAFGRENIKNLSEALRKTTPENPVVHYEGFVNIHNMPRWHKFICRATWSDDEKPVYTGSIGKIADIHNTYMKISDLRREASRDSLTGLLNHKHARKLIEEKLSTQSNTDFAMLIIDLDNFGDSNNRFGHIFGDEVLKYIASSIIDSVRSDDVAGRIGGDEFLIFMTYKPGAEAFIQRLYNNIAGYYKNFEINFSMGIALTSFVGREYNRLFTCADRALYAAKSGGRKHYRFYDKSMDKDFSAMDLSKDCDND